MPRPDPSLLDPARYPFRCALTTRFSDLDLNRHINNVAIAGLIEDAGVRFHHRSGFMDLADGTTSMVVSVAIEYLGQGYYPEPLDIHVATGDIGRTSYALHQLVTQQGRTVAYARRTFVCIRDDQPTPIPPVFAQSLGIHMLKAQICE